MAEQTTVRNVPADDLPEVLDLLLERLGLRLMCEKTPDYTSYELVPCGVSVLDGQAKNGEAPR